MSSNYEKLKEQHNKLKSLNNSCQEMLVGLKDESNQTNVGGNLRIAYLSNNEVWFKYLVKEEAIELEALIEKIEQRTSREAFSIKARLDAVDELLGGGDDENKTDADLPILDLRNKP